ncbi:MAG: hypothetical protein AAF514_03365 [Verrucomicrobiota bacterium]
MTFFQTTLLSLFLFALSLPLTNTQAQDEASKTPLHGVSYKKLGWEEGLFVHESKPYNGPSYEIYRKSGKVKMLAQFKGGKMHGVVLEFYENGTLKALTTFKEGKRHGKNNYWNKEGVLEKERVWENDELVDGEPD